MTLREIDDALAAWNSRLGTAAQNLMDLHAEPTYQQLTGTGGAPKITLSGETAAKVEPALGAMAAVFPHFGLLNETIDRAVLLRRNLPALFANDKLREIENLLGGKSIHLPPVDLPLEQRTLLSGVQDVECISPSDLLNTLVKAFQGAKDAVMAVSKAWAELSPVLRKSANRIASLRVRAATAGLGTFPELDTAEQILGEMRTRVQCDPFGATSMLDARIQPVLTRVEEAVNAREKLLRDIVNGMAEAHARIQTLDGLHRDCMAAADDARLKTCDCAALPSPLGEETIAGLAEWLGRLQQKQAEGLLEPLRIGLRNWNSAAEDCVVKERAALAANRAPVETRNELRGRLDALKAKARAYGVAENDSLVELAQQAEALLYTRPTAIDRAARAVAAYEKSLNSGKKPNAI